MQARLRPGARSHGLRLRPSPDPRPEHDRRLPVHARGPRRRQRPGSGPDRRPAGGGRAAPPRAGERDQHLPLQRPRLQGGCRSGQGADPGHPRHRRLQLAPNLPRRPVCERLQRLRPHLAGADPGRARVPQPACGHQPLLRPQQRRQHGAPGHAHHRQGHRRTRRRLPLQPLPFRPDTRRAGARVQQRPSRSRHGGPGRLRASGRLRLRVDRYDLPGEGGPGA